MNHLNEAVNLIQSGLLWIAIIRLDSGGCGLDGCTKRQFFSYVRVLMFEDHPSRLVKNY